MSNPIYSKFIRNFFLIFFVFIIDRISKQCVVYYSKENFGLDIFNSAYLNLSLTWNGGVAFGLLSIENNYIYNLITFLIFIIIVIIIKMIFSSQNLKKYSLILVAGGAIGNIYDRIFFNAVPDFIDLHYGNFHWFIFNVADIFITIGIFLLIIDEVVTSKK